MAYVLGSIPFFECLVRKEYTRNLGDGHGEFLPAVAHGIRSVRGHSLWFQCIFTAGAEAGAAFLVPIEALCWKPCGRPYDMTYVMPWDCFSSDFGVVELDFVKRGGVSVLPMRCRGQYRFTIDWAGSDLAEYPEQHKSAHVCFLETGLIGAFPNNRLLWDDPAFWTTTREKPDFVSLAGEFRAEGNQGMFRRREPGVVASDAKTAVGAVLDRVAAPEPAGDHGMGVYRNGAADGGATTAAGEVI